MKLSSIFLAGKTYREHNNGQNEIHIQTPILMLRPETIPGSCSFGILFSVTEADPEKPHTMQICVADNDGSDEREIAKGETRASKKQEEDNRFPPECFGFCGTVNARDVLFNHEGPHKLIFRIDGEEFEQTIPVYKR